MVPFRHSKNDYKMLPSLPVPVVSIAHSMPKIKRVKKVYAGEGWIGEGETETEAETDSA